MPPFDPHNAFLHAITPIVDAFWSLVWGVTGSTITLPPVKFPSS